MAKLSKVGTRLRFTIERFDGGRNTKESPSKILPSQSPDQLNTIYDDDGSVATRQGTTQFNTQIIGSCAGDGLTDFNGTMIAWAGGDMFRASGTTFVTIPSAQSQFNSGTKVSYVEYQGLLFMSDGTNGPWKYDGSNFYNMGIDTPSAATASGTSAGSVASGTYYYAVSFVNSQAVEGQIGSASVGVTINNTSTIGVADIPVGSSLAGVDERRIYRSTNASGPFFRVGTISDNVTTSFADTIGNDEEGLEAITDAAKPTPFTHIELHEERLFYPSNANASVLRYTNLENPFVSVAENFEPIANRDGDDIICTVSQEGLLTIFKTNDHFFLLTQDPADTTTWILRNSPSFLGCAGPRAFAKIDNGIVFAGRRNDRFTGFHYLSGSELVNTSDGRLRTDAISEPIETDLLTNTALASLSNIAMIEFDNKLYVSIALSGKTRNQNIYWFDLSRVTSLRTNDFGSWSLWDGIEANDFTVCSGLLYGITSDTTGIVFQMEDGTYNDLGTSAIDSYHWTAEVGGETAGELDSFVKDFREAFTWHSKVGAFTMDLKWRIDGDTGFSGLDTIDLDPGGTLWGFTWGVDTWGGTQTDVEKRTPIGKTRGRRIQFRFDNQNTIDQHFKVHRLEIGMNIRRPR